MENALAMPALDLFGEQVVIRRRSFEQRFKSELIPSPVLVQMGFMDILEMSDEELERHRQFDEDTDDYVDWLRGYLLKYTLRQLLHRQVSGANRREAKEWLMSDVDHPFSFKVCCTAYESDYLEVREAVLALLRKYMK